MQASTSRGAQMLVSRSTGRRGCTCDLGHRGGRVAAPMLAFVVADERHPRSARRRMATGAAQSTTAKTPPGLQLEAWTGSQQQLQALGELRLRMESCSYGCPDEETLRWYLRDRSFDVEEAAEKLERMLRWRRDFQPGSVTPAMVAKEAAKGKAYVHQQPDVYGRPAIVIRARNHVTGEFPLDDSKRLCVHLIDSAIAQLDSGPGSRSASSSDSDVGEDGVGEIAGARGEQILGIFDLRGFQVPQNADFVFAAFMVEAFFEYYPKRVGQVLMVDAPWVFGPAWEVIRPLMRKYAALVRFVSTDELRQEFFTPDTVPPEFR